MKTVKSRYIDARTKENEKGGITGKANAQSTEIIKLAAAIGKSLEVDLMHALEAIEHHLQHGFQGDGVGRSSNSIKSGWGDLDAATKLRETAKELSDIKTRVKALPVEIYNWIEEQSGALGK